MVIGDQDTTMGDQRGGVGAGGGDARSQSGPERRDARISCVRHGYQHSRRGNRQVS